MSETDRAALVELVRAALAELGDTADEVAQTLRAAGIVGRREEGCDCPVALFLARRIPELQDSDGWFRWNVERRGVSDDTGWVLDHPRAVEQFITAFDVDRAYDDLAAVYP